MCKGMIYLAQEAGFAKAIEAALRDAGLTVEWAPSRLSGRADDWLVAALDNSRLDKVQMWQRTAHEQGMNFLAVHVHNGEVVIGPHTRKDRSGCLSCWEKRCFRGRQKAADYTRLVAERDDVRPDPLLTGSAMAVVAQIVLQRILQIALSHTNADTDLGRLSVYYFDLATFTGREWSFVPDPICDKCGRLPADSPERAQIAITSRRKAEAGSDRLRPLKEMSFVEKAFVGHFSNIVSNRKYRWPAHREAVTTVAVPLVDARNIEPCHGLCTRYSDSDKVAVLEAVERYCGAEPRGFIPSVVGSYSNFRDIAVDPRTFGLHSQREYDANADLKPYHDDLKCKFVWAYSFRRCSPVLVPLDLGFYTQLRGPGDIRFIAREGSSGCSIGNSLEEAVLHGIFEVVERDAYMLAWYAKLSPPLLDPMTSSDPEVRHWVRRLGADGFRVTVVDATTDFGIPALLVIAVRENKWPNVVCSSGAHLYPEVALKKALRELYATLGIHEAGGDDLCREATALSRDLSKVVELTHHALAHSTLAALPYIELLTANTTCQSIREMEARVEALWSFDLSEELERVLEKIMAAGCDVLAVDQTAPEQRPYGLHTFKVLIPGAVPPCWGDYRRRFEHLPRLDAAVAGGWPETAPGKPQPNPIPHPFV